MSADIDSVMELLAEELRKPKKDRKRIDKLNKQLDKLLGTSLEEGDDEAGSAFESRRLE